MRRLLLPSCLLIVAFCVVVGNGVFDALTPAERSQMQQAAASTWQDAKEQALRQAEAQLQQPRAQIADAVKTLGAQAVDGAHSQMQQVMAEVAVDAKRQIAARADAALNPPPPAITGEAKP